MRAASTGLEIHLTGEEKIIRLNLPNKYAIIDDHDFPTEGSTTESNTHESPVESSTTESALADKSNESSSEEKPVIASPKPVKGRKVEMKPRPQGTRQRSGVVLNETAKEHAERLAIEAAEQKVYKTILQYDDDAVEEDMQDELDEIDDEGHAEAARLAGLKNGPPVDTPRMREEQMLKELLDYHPSKIFNRSVHCLEAAWTEHEEIVLVLLIMKFGSGRHQFYRIYLNKRRAQTYMKFQ